MINVLCLCDKTSGVSYHRFIVPFNYLNAHFPDDIHVDFSKDTDDIEYNKYDVIIFNRFFTDDSKIIDNAHKFGKKVIVDLDDYWDLPTHHLLFNQYVRNKLPERILYNIRNADCVTTTTLFFKSVISNKTTKPVFVIPNVINTEIDQFVSKPTTSEKLRLGLMGSIHHNKDIDILHGVYNSLADDVKEKVQICMCGFSIQGKKQKIVDGVLYQRDILPSESKWIPIEESLTSNYFGCSEDYKAILKMYDPTVMMSGSFINKQPYRRVWGLDCDHYATLYNQIDVLLVPLVNDTFNNCKSELKMVEAGNFNKPVICSDIKGYDKFTSAYLKGGSLDMEGTCLKAERPKDWKKMIELITRNEELRTTIANNLSTYVKMNYDIDTWSKYRLDLFKQILKSDL